MQETPNQYTKRRIVQLRMLIQSYEDYLETSRCTKDDSKQVKNEVEKLHGQLHDFEMEISA